MNTKQRFELIKRNTQEIVDESELKSLLTKKKTPTAYLGYAVTSLLHVGHLVPLVKMADFLKAGFKFTFLTADIHGYLDNYKAGWGLVDARAKVYEDLVKASIKSIGVDTKNLKFAKGSKHQYSRQYIEDLFILSGKVSLARARRAASEVVKFGEKPRLSGFIYPLMQTLDTKYLRAEVVFGGIDQRSIYMFSREVLPEIGGSKPICVFTPLISSLAGGKTGEKMSASVSSSKISLIDSEKDVKRKVSTAFCPAKQISGNPILELLRFAVFPILKNKKRKFIVSRPTKYGGDVKFNNYAELEKAYKSGKLHPADLKAALASELNKILAPIRRTFAGKKALLKKAYPNLC